MCQFRLPITGDATSLLQRAKQEITASGGVFDGDNEAGIFHAKTPIGSIEGTYQVEANEIALNITKKPFLLSCNRIKKELTSVMK